MSGPDPRPCASVSRSHRSQSLVISNRRSETAQGEARRPVEHLARKAERIRVREDQRVHGANVPVGGWTARDRAIFVDVIVHAEIQRAARETRLCAEEPLDAVRQKFVVVVKNGYPRRLRQFQAAVEVAHQPEGARVADMDDAAFDEGAQQRRVINARRGVVHDDHPHGHGLRQCAPDGGGQIAVAPVDGDGHSDIGGSVHLAIGSTGTSRGGGGRDAQGRARGRGVMAAAQRRQKGLSGSAKKLTVFQSGSRSNPRSGQSRRRLLR